MILLHHSSPLLFVFLLLHICTCTVYIIMLLSSDVKDDSHLGDPSWGLGLFPRGNLVLKVNLVCGPLGGQRSWDP